MKAEEIPIGHRLKGLWDYAKHQREKTIVRTVMAWYDKLYKKNYTSLQASRIVVRAKKIYKL